MQKSCLNYPVEFTEDVFGGSVVLADVLKRVTEREEPKVLIVADLNVVQRTEGLGSRIGRYVQDRGIALAGSPVVVAGGEKAKADNLQSALKVVSALLAAKLGANDVVLAIGGGTILDVAGYAAAQVRGGVRIVRMPTTPAAMMDAAFASYAAVDSATVKDALRVPSAPAAVVIDPAFALTVLDGVWRGGVGEAVRLGMACDAAFFRKVATLEPACRVRDTAAFRELLEAAVAVRRKKGPTTLGEWAAFRLESMSGYRLPHGYAMCIGLCLELGYAVEAGLLKPEARQAAEALLRDCGALDGLAHSGHLLNQAESLLFGLDAWALSSGRPAVTLPVGIGRSREVENPDRELYRKVSKFLAAAPEVR